MQWHLNGIVPVPDGQTGLLKVIRHGSLGEVIEATWNVSPCAIKLFTRKQMLSLTIQRHTKRFDHEMKHWAPCLSYPNLVQFLGLWEDKDEDGASTEGLVMERLHTDLHTFMKALQPTGRGFHLNSKEPFFCVCEHVSLLTDIARKA